MEWCRFVILASLLAVTAILPASALESEVLVTLFNAHPVGSRLYLSGPVRLLTASECKLPDNACYVISRGQGKFKIERLSGSGAVRATVLQLSQGQFVIAPYGGSGNVKLGPALNLQRRYRGTVAVSLEKSHIVCRNRVLMKDYVNAVVAGETLARFPEEALKAQSVLIQTSMSRYKKGDELNDSTERQVYLGADQERAVCREAVRKTWGQTLSIAGRPVPVYFHAACAGGTSTSRLFTGKSSGIACDRAVKCSYCSASPFYKKTRHRIPLLVFKEKFPEGFPRLKNPDEAGRPTLVEYDNWAASGLNWQNKDRGAGLKAGKQECAYAFWLKVGQRLGWDKLPGTRFFISAQEPGYILLESTGAGHGVGLCQWGACGMAEKGSSYDKILRFYFPGAKLLGCH